MYKIRTLIRKIMKKTGTSNSTPQQWSKFKRQLVLTSHSADVFKITKI